MTKVLKQRGIIRFTRRSQVDWSHLKDIYEELQSVPAVARRLGTTEKITYAELKDQGIQLRSRGHLKGQKKSDSWREASAKNWNDPAWREEQRRKWLEKVPSRRKGPGISPLEKFLHEALRRARFSFKTNEVVLNGRYVVDVLLIQQKIAIEVDGSSHWLHGAQEYDAVRQTELEQAGFIVRRIDHVEVVNNADGFVSALMNEFDLHLEEQPQSRVRSDADAFGDRMNALRADPKKSRQWRENLTRARRERAKRERQMKI
jgi:very-short-patch-repair endonuclease